MDIHKKYSLFQPEGGVHWDFGFCGFGYSFRSVFVFVAFSFFSIQFSVYVESNSGFFVFVSNVVCIRFSVLAEFFGGFGVLDDFFLRFCGF